MELRPKEIKSKEEVGGVAPYFLMSLFPEFRSCICSKINLLQKTTQKDESDSPSTLSGAYS